MKLEIFRSISVNVEEDIGYGSLILFGKHYKTWKTVISCVILIAHV